MADLKLDATTGDLAIENNDLVIIDGVDAMGQHVKIRLRLFRGEWFLDVRVGIPYYEKILVKNPDLVAVRAIFREAILETQGIVDLLDFALTVDSATRTMNLRFTATTDTDELLVFNEEFLIAA